MYRRGAALWRFGDGVVNFHHGVNIAYVDETIAQCARHLPVDLGDHKTRRFCRRFGTAHLNAKRTETVFVGRGHLYEGKIQWQWAAAEEIGHFTQKNGRKIGVACLHGVAHIRADEERIVAKVPGIARIDIGRCAKVEQMHQFHVSQLSGAPHQGID